jgi:hypothetical protein
MTGPKGDVAPEWGGLGKRRPRKDEEAKKPAAPAPAPGIDPGKFIEMDAQGRMSTNDPRNEAANVPDITLPTRHHSIRRGVFCGWAVLCDADGWHIVYPD